MRRIARSRSILLAATAGTALILYSAGMPRAAETNMSLYLKGTAGFMAGFLPPQEGSYITPLNYYFDGSAGADIRGGVVEAGVDITLNFAALQGTFVTDWHPLGGQYAFGVLVDYVWASLDASITGPLGNTLTISPTNSGISDALVQPFIIGWHDGNWHWNVNMSVVLPTGAYSQRELNVGRNVFALMPAAAVTYFDPESGFETSAVLTYVTSWENDVTQYQSGDIVHLDWAIGLHIDEWVLGVQGNYENQITGDSGPGALLGSNKLESWGLGPAVNYAAKFGEVPVQFSAKWEHDFDATRTFEGDVVQATATIVF